MIIALYVQEGLFHYSKFFLFYPQSVIDVNKRRIYRVQVGKKREERFGGFFAVLTIIVMLFEMSWMNAS